MTTVPKIKHLSILKDRLSKKHETSSSSLFCCLTHEFWIELFIDTAFKRKWVAYNIHPLFYPLVSLKPIFMQLASELNRIFLAGGQIFS